MDKIISSFLIIFHFIIILTVVIIVGLTSFVPEYKNLLDSCTKENAFFETGTFIVLLMISIYCFFTFRSAGKHEKIKKNYMIFILFTGILSLIGAFEEISWGQHIIEFPSNEFFMQKNRQHETNLHNLISPEFFGLAVNAAVYCIFIFLPIFIKFNEDKDLVQNLPFKICMFIPSVQNILMFGFAFSLQAYFIYETFADTAALILALIFAGILIFGGKRHRNKLNILHLIILISAAFFFMMNYHIFKYENMQYEIREFVISYAFLFWLINLNLKISEHCR